MRNLVEPSFGDKPTNAGTVARPADLPGGHVWLHGVAVDPMAKTQTNAALHEITRLMAAAPYMDIGHPLHGAHVLAVQELMGVLHPEA